MEIDDIEELKLDSSFELSETRPTLVNVKVKQSSLFDEIAEFKPTQKIAPAL